MTKELDALNYLYNDLRLMKCLDVVEEAKVKSAYKCLQQALTELKAIKEAEPSEALKCLHKVASKVELADCDDYWEVRNAYAKVEQALLKQLSGSQYTDICIDEAIIPSDAINSLNKLWSSFISSTRTSEKYVEENPFVIRHINDYDSIKEALLKAEKLEKVLEIIKKKDVDIFMLKRFKTLKAYNNYTKDNKMKELTQEEFDLLKEVLKNE